MRQESPGGQTPYEHVTDIIQDQDAVDRVLVQDANAPEILSTGIPVASNIALAGGTVPVQHFGVTEAVRALASERCNDDMRSFIVSAKLLHPASNLVITRSSFFCNGVIPEHRWHSVQIVAALELIINKYSAAAEGELTCSDSKREKLNTVRLLRNQIYMRSLEINQSVIPSRNDSRAYERFLHELFKFQKTLGKLIADRAEDLGRGRLKAALEALSKQLDQSTVNVEKLVAKATNNQQAATPAAPTAPLN